jgi:transcriptional regulator with XRE-family HTH domain
MEYIPSAVLPSQFGAQFRRERKSKKLTQQEVASRAGLSRLTIIQLERGENVGLHSVMAAIGALDMGLRIDTIRINYDDIGRFDDDA